jgi:hypothetical protein
VECPTMANPRAGAMARASAGRHSLGIGLWWYCDNRRLDAEHLTCVVKSVHVSFMTFSPPALVVSSCYVRPSRDY